MGKRSGNGFIAHKATLVNALSRAVAERVILMDIALGRKGFLGYLKSLGGSNIVKIIPSNGSASEERTIGKRLKVICGANTSELEQGRWIKENTPMSLCDVRVSPNNSVKPNVGANELAEAISRVLPFTATEDNRPVLQCVNFSAKDGKLTLVSADGFRLAILSLDYDDGEGQALINRGDLQGIANALKRSKRARVSFENGGEKLDSVSLVIDTELIRYKWMSVDGEYPDYEKLIPEEFTCTAHFDTVEAVKAVSSLKALYGGKSNTVDLIIGEGKIVMASPDDSGEVELVADTDGEVKIRFNLVYLAQVLKACGGMVDFKLQSGSSPALFTVDGYRVVVMPLLTPEAKAEQEPEAEQEPKPKPKRKRKAKAEAIAEEPAEAEAVAEEPAEAVAVAEEPVAV